MTKDPAFLFYPTDFMALTMDLNDAEIGQFIKLLCLQHQTGHFSVDSFQLLTRDEASQRLMGKFVQDENGNIYNHWLEELIKKRKAYTDSRRKNRLNKKKTYNDST